MADGRDGKMRMTNADDKMRMELYDKMRIEKCG